MSTSRLHETINQDIATLTEFKLTELGKRLHTALEIELRHPSTPDGMPTQSIGAAPSTSPQGSQDADVALTSVEAAVEARRRHRDEVRRVVTMSIAHLGEARRHLQSATAVLDALDKLRVNKDESREPGCRAIARIEGAWEGVAHTATIDGDVWPLGTWAYGFYSRQGRIPTIDECKAHLAGNRVMVKAS